MADNISVLFLERALRDLEAEDDDVKESDCLDSSILFVEGSCDIVDIVVSVGFCLISAETADGGSGNGNGFECGRFLELPDPFRSSICELSSTRVLAVEICVDCEDCACVESTIWESSGGT